MDATKLFYFYLCDVWREFMLLVEQNFQEFGEAVVLWAYGMTDRKMSDDWPDRLADFLADWTDEHGTIVEDESLPVLFDWVAALGRQRGALPRDANVAYPEDAWMKYRYNVPAPAGPPSGAPVIDGVLTLRAKDIGDLTWRELLRSLAAYRLPSDVRALMILVDGRGPLPFCTIYLSAELLRAFLQLPLADRQSIMAAAGSGIVEAAQGAIARAVGAHPRAAMAAKPRRVEPVINGLVTLHAKDVGDATWRDLLHAVAANRLPADALELRILVHGRGPLPFCTIFLSAELLRAFLQLRLADRRAVMSEAGTVNVEAAQAAIARAVAVKAAEQLQQQPSPAQQNPAGGKLAPSSRLPYNQDRSPAAPASPQPKELAAVDAERQRQAGDQPARFVDPSARYRLYWAFDWAAADQARVSASLRRVEQNLPALISEAQRELNSLSPCVRDKLGPWLTDFKSALQTMQNKFRGNTWLYIRHSSRGAQGPLADSWPHGGENWYYYETIRLNDDGTYNWRTMPTSELDKLLFHELLHLASAKILDDDATNELYNANRIQSMINVGIAGNGFYRREKQKAIDECKR